jgi:WD40 repeat protein
MDRELIIMRRSVDRAGFVVRILAVGSHRPVGVGFLVDECHLVTCAHVINAALDRPVHGQDEPDPDVRVPIDFPILGDADGAPVRLCRIACWLPPPPAGTTGDDIAGLMIVGEGAPGAAGPARLPEDPSVPVGSEVHVFGHPAAFRHGGSWATARIRGRVGGGMLQVDSDLASAVRLQPGYSGSPLVVAGADGDAVVGMLSVASTRDDRRDAYGVPVERLIRAWPDVLAGVPPSPYRGLRPFTSADEGVFFGREDDVERLWSMVEHDTLALVVGPSGIGKSSLVGAGLIPRWRAAGGVAAIVRPGAGASNPLGRVLADLGAALRAATGQDAWSFSIEDVKDGLAAAVSRRAAALELSVLISFDQFEELLIGTPPDDRRELVEALLPGRDASLPCRVVATMRADFLPSLLELPGQGQRLGHRVLLLSPMSVAALERAVTEPARTVGVAYERGLAGQIAADASGGAGGLPLMAFTLSQLWQTQRGRRLTFADYREFGGVAGAINRYAERVYGRLHAEGLADRVKAIMLALVRSRGGAAEASSRAVPLPRFDGMRPLIDDLCRERLLVVDTGSGDGEPLVRLAHESLVRAWPRFARWVDEDADFQRWLATMEERVADDELLADSHVATAEQWLAERGPDIPEDVVQLVHRSRTVLRQRIAELEAARAAAVEAAAEAEARRLAAAAELATATSGAGAVPLVLAAESVKTCWTLEGDSALRHALRTAPVPIAEIPCPPSDKTSASLMGSGTHIARETVTFRQSSRGQTQLFKVDVDEGSYHEVYQAEDTVQFSHDARLALRVDSHWVTVIDCQSGATMIDDRGRSPVASAVLSSDGTRVAVVRGQSAKEESVGPVVHQATIDVIDVATGSACHRMRFGTLRGYRTFNADCSLLATMTQYYDEDTHHKWMGTTTVHDLVAGDTIAELRHDGEAWNKMVFSPDGSLLAAGSNSVDSCGDAHTGNVEVFDLAAQGALLFRMYQYLPVQALTFDPEGKRLAVAIGDPRHRQTPGAGLLLEARTGRELHRLHHDYRVESVGFNPSGSRVVFGGVRSARVFEVARGEELLRVDHEQNLAGVEFGPDDRMLVTATQDYHGPTRLFRSRSVEIWRIDWDDWRERAIVSADGSRVCVTFNDWSRGYVPYDQRVDVTKVVDPMTGTVHHETSHPTAVRLLATSSDARWLAFRAGGEVHLHDVVAGTPPLVIRHDGYREVGHARIPSDERVVSVARLPSPYRRDMALANVRITSLRDGATMSATDLGGELHSLSEDGTLCVIRVGKPIITTGALEDDLLALVRTHDGTEVCRFHAGTDQSARFSPEGDWLAALSERAVTVLRTSDGTRVWTAEFDAQPRAIAVDPTGALLAVAGGPGPTTLFDARTGARLATYESAAFPGLSFSPDGRRLAIESDGAASVIELESGQTLCVVDHERSRITRASFLDRAGQLLLTMDDRSLRVSSVDTAPLVAEARARLARELTESERRRYRLAAKGVAD